MALLALLAALALRHADALRVPSRQGAAGIDSGPPGGLQNTTMPSWFHKDGVCVDSPYGWADSMGNTCQDYQAKYFCTKTGAFGAGWWPVWGEFSNYATQNHTADTACCACGGGMLSCCPSHIKLEAEIAQELAPLNAYVHQLEGEVTANMTAAGTAEEAKFREFLASHVPNVSRRMVNASMQQREQMLADARALFDNQTLHREQLTEAAKGALIEASYAAARGALNQGSTQRSAGRLAQALKNASGAIHTAALRWEQVATAGKDVAERGVQAVKEYFPSAHSHSLTISGTIDQAKAFFDASQKAQEKARFSQQALAVATDVSGAAEARSQAVDAQVRQSMARAQTALRATAANSGKLDTLEAMVDSAEAAAQKLSSQLR